MPYQKYTTPLRYPGGKGRLAPFIKSVLEHNDLRDGTYIEPFAGGAGVAIDLLLTGHVQNIIINDLNYQIYAFWKTVISDPDYLINSINEIDFSIGFWDRQKKIFQRADFYELREVAFATLFLNRTNRSGILNGGPIGGREQKGEWKIDARFNQERIIEKIRRIAAMGEHITVSQQNAIELLENYSGREKNLIYVDPPYYVQGRNLYYDHFKEADHLAVRDTIRRLDASANWIVSYDSCEEIAKLYREFKGLEYNIGYSARDARKGTELMYFSSGLKIPELIGPFKMIQNAQTHLLSSLVA